MSTLLLRLAGPMQSWGTDSKFDVRRTGREPSKSGVIGLVAAALGIARQDRQALQTLNSLRFGVRVDREGALLRDFHTARPEKGTPYVTYRYYLSDWKATIVRCSRGSRRRCKLRRSRCILVAAPVRRSAEYF